MKNELKDQAAMTGPEPLYYIHSQAPMRICDLGGWTDTWFAQFGQVLHIAVAPYAQVQFAVYPRKARQERVEVFAENFAERFIVQLGLEPSAYRQRPHPLLQAAIAYIGVPEDLALEITIFSEMPSGASTGTSAAVSVALAAAMDQLRGGCMTPYELAMLAQSVETKWLGQQCGRPRWGEASDIVSAPVQWALAADASPLPQPAPVPGLPGSYAQIFAGARDGDRRAEMCSVSCWQKSWRKSRVCA